MSTLNDMVAVAMIGATKKFAKAKQQAKKAEFEAETKAFVRKCVPAATDVAVNEATRRIVKALWPIKRRLEEGER
jgi:hypothetical protein